MIKRMPLKVNGRDVHITPLEGEEHTAKEVWNTIMNHVGDGEWLWIKGTAELDNKAKQRLRKALKNRAWFAGYNQDMICMRLTEVEGICFRWLGGNAPDQEVVEHNRKERLEHRRVKQKEQRAKKRNQRLTTGGVDK